MEKVTSAPAASRPHRGPGDEGLRAAGGSRRRPDAGWGLLPAAALLLRPHSRALKRQQRERGLPPSLTEPRQPRHAGSRPSPPPAKGSSSPGASRVGFWSRWGEGVPNHCTDEEAESGCAQAGARSVTWSGCFCIIRSVLGPDPPPAPTEPRPFFVVSFPSCRGFVSCSAEQSREWEPPRAVSSGPICSPLGATSRRQLLGGAPHLPPHPSDPGTEPRGTSRSLSPLATRRPSPLCPVSSRMPAVASAPRTKVILYALLLKAVPCGCPRPRAG